MTFQEPPTIENYTAAELWIQNIRINSIILGNLKSVPFNPIPTGLGHVMLIYGLIPPMAGRNRVKIKNRTFNFLNYNLDSK